MPANLLILLTFFIPGKNWSAWDGHKGVYSFEKRNDSWFLVAYDTSHHERKSVRLPSKPRAVCASPAHVVLSYNSGGVEVRDPATLGQRLFRSTSRAYISLECSGDTIYAGGRFLGVVSMSPSDLVPHKLSVRLHSWACCMLRHEDSLFIGSWDHAVHVYPSGQFFTHYSPVYDMAAGRGFLAVLINLGRIRLWSWHGRLLGKHDIRGAISIDAVNRTLVVGKASKRVLITRVTGSGRVILVSRHRVPIRPLELTVLDTGASRVLVHNGEKSWLLMLGQ